MEGVIMSEQEASQSIRLPDPAKLIVSNSPHMRSGDNIRKIMFTVVAAMLPACVAGIWFFGLAALNVLLLCTVSCVLFEEGWNKLAKRPSTWKDGSAIITGILLGMNLNAGVPWWVCIIGGFRGSGLPVQLWSPRNEWQCGGRLRYNWHHVGVPTSVGPLCGESPSNARRAA